MEFLHHNVEKMFISFYIWIATSSKRYTDGLLSIITEINTYVKKLIALSLTFEAHFATFV